MSLYVDRKYVSLLSSRLQGFTRKDDYVWNFRCPLCGDSHKNKVKKRGYIYRRKSDLFFSCHNCGASITLSTLIKQLDPTLYREYQLERFCDSMPAVKEPDLSRFMEKPIFNNNTTTITHDIALPKVSSLADDHPAKIFISRRKIPADTELYFAEDFKVFVNTILPDQAKALISDDPRIIIPFRDENSLLLGFQGRTITKSKIRYITIKVSEEGRKIYGLDRVDFTKKVYVTEGPLDSRFLNNALATMDADLIKVKKLAGTNHDYTLVFDNEPRNREVCKYMLRAIEQGMSVCIWPKTIEQKDINEMVLAGVIDPQNIIDTHTYKDHQALLEFNIWKKI